MTNFSAVCVAEKRDDLDVDQARRPFPAAITACSEISGRPLGRITQIAPFGFSERFSFSQPRELGRLRRAEEDRVADGLTTRPMERWATARLELLQEVWSSTPIAETRQSGFTPIFSRRDGGCRILSAHFAAAAPRSNDAVRPENVTRQRAAARGDLRICFEGNRQLEVAAAELQHVGFQPRLAGRGLALESHVQSLRRPCRFVLRALRPWPSAHLDPGPVSRGPWSAFASRPAALGASRSGNRSIA